MKLLDDLQQQLGQLQVQSLQRRRRTADSPCAPRVVVDGRDMLAFCSNDYLGLAAHPQVVEALREGASLYGAGSGASHLVSGHGRAHAQLEERLAEFLAPHLEQARALYFCTGYMANLALLGALGGADAMIFSEGMNHASLIDGCRLARAQVQVYPHGDIDALEKMLIASTAATKLVVTDSVFSMDGDIAPLPQLLALCERHDAWLVIDDAHGFGVLGEHGRGALEHFGLRSPNLVYMGTLGKAAGVGGAFVAAHETVIEWLVQRSRPYIYTTAAAPALAHALLTSLDLIAGTEGHARRAHLQALIGQLDATLTLQRWQRLPSITAIQPVVIGANQESLDAAAALHEQGLWVPAIRPPTVPRDTARLRVTLSASHTVEQVAQLARALNALEARTA
ncbi:8-amino-7-oxononanoate synthase [Noviherbaspirillum sedimenti]|uniref:8-amino-7-oxononanoate synthase n=1 Tax=Noviherbaspirillum sedimenti TaxID=2320865 RepID=A0A3A3G3J0_9BURK|nr:8-amino-7-oxononanoate synthase [Noviherbaspirillum sedimenti]RJG02501.1 8-amino-7-oxononanoate synthase [Noviherbaspirillum sedimenti]